MPNAARTIAFSGLSYIVHLGRQEFAFQEVEYADKLEGVELLTHIGYQEAHARTRGIYKPEPVKIKQVRAEWDAMMVFFPSNGFGNYLFPITITGADPVLPMSVDRIIDCTIMESKAKIEATGKAAMVEFSAQPRQIIFNGKTINFRRGAPRNGRLSL
jgi:hypothetical protein